MTDARRAAYFQALLANRTGMLSPSYRRLWQSQVYYYSQENGDSVAPEVGNSEAHPLLCSPAPSPKFRAPNESAWARLFDALGVAWKYEALEPALSRALRYMPDFWLCDLAVWFEVKSATPTEGEAGAARELLAADSHRVYLVTGWPQRKRYGVWVFAEAGEVQAGRGDICDLALCNLFDCSFERLYEAFGEVRNGNKSSQ